MLYIVLVACMAAASSVAIRVIPLIGSLNQAQSSRYKTLDGFRGFLAIGVFISHAYVANYFYKTGEWAPPASNMYRFAGTGSVALFFMITGLLFWAKAIDRRIEPMALLKSRILRIMPLHLFSCIIIFFICFHDSNFTIAVQSKELIFSMTRWLAGGAFGAPPINGITTLTVNAGVTWTLQYEWAFYLLLPLVGFFATPGRFVIFVILYFVIFASLRLIGLSDAATYMLVAIPFLGGMVAAHLTKHLMSSDIANRVFQTLFVITSFVAGAYFYTNGARTIVGLLLVPAFVLVAMGNDIFGLLTFKWARWLGQISFSIYILHGIVLLFCLRIIDPYLPVAEMGSMMYIAICAVIGILLVMICSTTYIVIERKFMNMANRRMRQPLRTF